MIAKGSLSIRVGKTGKIVYRTICWLQQDVVYFLKSLNGIYGFITCYFLNYFVNYMHGRIFWPKTHNQRRDYIMSGKNDKIFRALRNFIEKEHPEILEKLKNTL